MVPRRGLPGLRVIVLASTLLLFAPALRANQPSPIDFTEIQSLAFFASAAYRSEADIRAWLGSNRYTLTRYHTLADVQVSFFLATDDSIKTHVVSIRGTSNISNAMVDISFDLQVDQKTGLKLHRGFSFAARQVLSELKPLLEPDYKIKITGHSMGGAVALILAMYLDAERFDIDSVVTFGQPKITNIPGANGIQHIDVIRVVTPFDLVPLLPPLDPLDIRNIDVYWHAGREIILLEDTRYAILEGVESMLRATRFTQRPLNEENLEFHRMANYLQSIEAKVKSATRVPYPTSLNLFNLLDNNQAVETRASN